MSKAERIRRQVHENVLSSEDLAKLTKTASVFGQQPVASLPCHVLPVDPDSDFFGREELLGEIEDKLTASDNDDTTRAVALCGETGVGTSQLALKFALRRINYGILIVLWMNCESEYAMSNSFRSAARKLKLSDAQDSYPPSVYRDLVLNFLHATKEAWLLIFDNVYKPMDLPSCWPVNRSGNIIITGLQYFDMKDYATRIIDVVPLQQLESLEWIQRVVAQKGDLSDEEFDSRQSLAKLVRGHPLTLKLVTEQIKARKTSVSGFLKFFSKNLATVQERCQVSSGLVFDIHFHAVLEGSLLSLSTNATRLLMLLCYVGPSDIPEMLCTDAKRLPEAYKFLSDSLRFDSAKLELANLRMVTLNNEDSLMSISRLTQQACLKRASTNDHRQASGVVTSLLYEVFARPVGRHLYTRWEMCSRAIQHVHAFMGRCKNLSKIDDSLVTERYTCLLKDAAWYLAEIGSFRASQILINIAIDHCTDQNSLLFAQLCDVIGTIHDRQAHSVVKALSFYERSLVIRRAKLLENSVAVANSYSAVGNGLTGLYFGHAGVNECTKAINLCPDDAEEKLKWNPDRYFRNRARSLFGIANYEEAKRDLRGAEIWQAKIHGEDSHYDGETAYMLGKIAMVEEDYDEAHDQLERAHRLLSKGKPLHPSATATKYLLGKLLMLQGRNQEALDKLKEALNICQLLSVDEHDSAECVRIIWQISKCHTQLGNHALARQERREAGRLEKVHLATGLYPNMVDKEQQYDSFVGLLYR